MSGYTKLLRYAFIVWVVWIFGGIPAFWLYGRSKFQGDGVIWLEVGLQWTLMYLMIWFGSAVLLLAAFIAQRRAGAEQTEQSKQALRGWLRLHLGLFLLPLVLLMALQIYGVYTQREQIRDAGACPSGLHCEIRR